MTDHEFEPLAGDEALLRRKALEYGEIANAITRSVNTLKRIKEVGEMKGKAVNALRDSIGSVAADIDKARDRYAGTSSALVTYSYALGHAQDAAGTAISHIHVRLTEASQAHHRAANLNDQVPTATDGEKADARTAADRAADTAATADAELRAAHQEWHAALAIKNDAATVAVSAIKEVVDGKKSNGLNDTLWDDWGKGFVDVLKTVCEIAGFLAIFLSWVPILGAVLVGLAILGALITLIESIVKLVNGQGSITDVIFAAVGVVLAAFGGKLAAYLAKLVKVQAITRFARKGSSDFLKSGAFKTMFGKTKTSMLQDPKLASAFREQGFGSMMKDIRNPFDLKLGSGSNLWARVKDGVVTEGIKAAKNPLGLKSVTGDMSVEGRIAGILSHSPTSEAKVALVVLDARSVADKVEKVADTVFGVDLTLKPESILRAGVDQVENSIRGVVGAELK